MSAMRTVLEGIKLLGRTEGLFTETAGGVTVAVTKRLAEQGKFADEGTVVIAITGNGFENAGSRRRATWRTNLYSAETGIARCCTANRKTSGNRKNSGSRFKDNKTGFAVRAGGLCSRQNGVLTPVRRKQLWQSVSLFRHRIVSSPMSRIPLPSNREPSATLDQRTRHPVSGHCRPHHG